MSVGCDLQYLKPRHELHSIAMLLLYPRPDIDIRHMSQAFDSPDIPKNHSSPVRWLHGSLKYHTNQMITRYIQSQYRFLGSNS